MLAASYKIAYRMAKEKKPHSIAETLIKPCALEMTETVCGLDQKRKLEGIPMTNKVVKSRIDGYFRKYSQTSDGRIGNFPFPICLQLDESTY